MTEARPSNYWIASNALYITLNANGGPDYLLGNTASGAHILCYIKGIDGLEYDAGHNYRRWPLSLTPTHFETHTEKYVYCAIPRPGNAAEMAVIVFPSERLDIYGKNETGQQIGSEQYYYIWLQGIISSSGFTGANDRGWTQHIDTGTLASDEAIDAGGDQTWWRYSAVDDTVTFLKEIVMDAKSVFHNLKARLLVLAGHELTGVATADTSDEFVDSETLVVTPSYLKKNTEDKFLRKDQDDATPYSLTVGGNLSVGGILRAVTGYFTSLYSNLVQSTNYTGEGIADTGYRLTADDGTGSSALTVDNLHVRKKATFEELEVKKETSVAGNEIRSAAANVINRTDYIDQNGEIIGYSNVKVPWMLRKMPFLLRHKFFGRLRKVRIVLSSEDAERIARIRCYFLAKDDDTEVDNMWRVGDLARCQSINIASTTRSLYIEGRSSVNRNIYWWRKVVAAADTAGYHKITIDDKEYHYFDVSMTDCDEGSDIPAAGDHVVQFGNDHDPNRMNIMISEVNSADAPAAKDYEGVYTFDLNKNWWQQGQADESPMVYRRSPRAGVKIVSTKFELITRYSVAPVPIERGAWVTGMVYYYYDIVQHKGASWLCVASTGNRYQALEDISAQIPAGTILTQEQYDTLSVEQKIKCTRTATGSTDLEPSEQNIAVWRPYAQKGATGQSAFKSTMFCRMTNTPAKPTHGSYKNPSPADPAGTDADGEVITWSDGIPDGTKQLWASTRIFSSDGQAPQQSEWNDARKMTDTETYDVEFAKKQTNDAKPAEPNGHNQHGGDQPQVWFDPTLDSSTDFTQMYWRAERTIINGVPGSWVIVRIKGEKGDKGTSIKSVTSYYAKTNRALVMPRDDQEVTWEESLSALGEIAEGWYVWTKNITTYSDTLENTTTYTVSKWGIDGDGIENIETKFYEDSRLLTQQQLAALTEDKWKEYNQLALTKGDYIYTRTKITYDKASTPTISYQVNRIGQDGVSYLTTEEYYCLGNSATTPPTGHPYQRNDGKPESMTPAEMAQRMQDGSWSESRPTYRGDANKYIWNFEASYDTTTNVQVTQPLCIGDYSKGISTIVETYTISSHSTKAAMLADTAERTAHPWVDEVQDSAPTDALPYQWNKTVTTYTDGSSDTFYHVSAVKGTRGRSISNTNIYYKADTTTPATPSGAPAQSGWSDDGNSLITDSNSAKHLYESTCTTYSDGTYSWTTPIDDGLISDMAATSEEFALADSGTTAPTTGWSASVTPTAGKWVWSRTVLTFKNGNKKYVNTQCVGYCGTNGKSITKASADTFRYAIGDSGITPPTSGWSSTKPSSFDKDKWLWTETTIHWSDNSTTVLYSAERNPNDGVAGQDIIVDGSTEMKYYVGDSNTTHPAEDSSDWKDISQVTQTQGKWLWSKATTWYRKASSAAGSKDAGHSVNYNVSYISKDGAAGRAVTGIKEYYKATSSSAEMPVPTSDTGWSTNPNVSNWGATDKYLWNYEKVTYSSGTTVERTKPQIVAIWTKDGKGIDSIINYYKITSSATPPSKPSTDGGDGWDDDPTAPGAGEYLWNYEKVTYTDGSVFRSEVQLIGHVGKDGQSITKKSESYRYATNNTGTRPAATSTDWKTTKPTLQKGYWLYTETTITWSDGSTTVLYTDERNPNDGVPGQSITISSQSVKYSKQSSGNLDPTTLTYGNYPSSLSKGDWLYSKTTVTYSDNTHTDSYGVTYIGTDGTEGRGITGVYEHYKASASKTGETTPSGTSPTDWGTNPNPSDWNASKPYLWNYERITYSKGTTVERTSASVIAVWTENGRSVDSIVNFYKKSNKSSGVGYPASDPDGQGSAHSGGTETGWSSAVQSPDATDNYLWNYERVTWIEKDGTTTYTYSAPHVIGHFGKDGTSPYFADIDNEMDSVALDANGKTTAAYSKTIGVMLYHGSEEMTLTDIVISGTTDAVTATKNVANKTITVSVAAGTSIPLTTELTITPKATGAPNDQSVHFVLNGVKPGANGQHATLYSLIPDANVITKDADGTPTFDILNFTIIKRVGTAETVITSISSFSNEGLKLYYKVGSESEVEVTTSYMSNGEYTNVNYHDIEQLYGATYEKIEWILRKASNNQLLDKEGIGSVKDGEKGTSTEHVSVYKAQSDKPATPTGTVVPPSGWSIVPVSDKESASLTFTYTGAWSKSGNVYTSNDIGDNDITKEKVSFSTTEPVTVKVKLTASSEPNYDYVLIGNPDEDSVTRTSNYKQRVSGTDSVEVELEFGSAGEHFFVVAYAKDVSGESSSDNGKFEILGAYKSNAIPIWVSTSKLVNDVCDGNWSEPVRWNGKNGDDAWSVAASPSPLIINQNIDNASDFGLPIEINFTGKCGDNTATVGTVNATNSMGLGITAGSGKITITSYSKVNGAYVTSGVIVCIVPLSYGSRSTNFTFKISVGVNMIGQFSDEIKGDMRTELAHSTLYKIEDGVLVETENWGEFYRSSTENISLLTKQVNNGKNLFGGVLTGDGWKLNGSDIETDEDDKFILNGGVLESTDYQVNERDGYYTLSYEASSAPNQNNVKLYVDGELTDVPCNYGQRDGRFFVKFNSFWGDDDEYYMDGELKFRFSDVTYIRHPQLEAGANATEFEASSKETTSKIKQTADEIEAKVNDTGINISTGEVTVFGGKFSMKPNKSSAATFELDSNGNLVSKGSAQFEGKVKATSGEFTGEVHATSGEFSGKITATSGDIAGPLNVTGELNVKNSSNTIKVKINGGSVSTESSPGEITIVDAEGFYVKRGSEGFRLTTQGFQRWNSFANSWVNFYGGRYIRTITLTSTAATAYNVSAYDDFIIANPTVDDTVLNLPSSNIPDGKILEVVNTGPGIHIRAGSLKIQGAREYDQVTININDRMEFIYSSSSNKWYANYMPKVDEG